MIAYGKETIIGPFVGCCFSPAPEVLNVVLATDGTCWLSHKPVAFAILDDIEQKTLENKILVRKTTQVIGGNTQEPRSL